MKNLIIFLLLFGTLNTHAVWDFLQKTPPNLSYMNYFYKGYIPWFEKTFKTELAFPGSSGRDFFLTAIKNINHWKVPGHLKFDQLLIGQSFKDGSPVYSISIYLHPAVRSHAYLRAKNLPFSPDMIQWDGKQLCYAKFISEEELENYCGPVKQLIKLQIKESKTFSNKLEGLSDWELTTTTTEGKIISSFFYIKDLHTAFIPKEFYPIILNHGSEANLPLDKFSLDENGMTVYYP